LILPQQPTHAAWIHTANMMVAKANPSLRWLHLYHKAEHPASLVADEHHISLTECITYLCLMTQFLNQYIE
jgi:hypothetical protein